jgi:hypothetical protein
MTEILKRLVGIFLAKPKAEVGAGQVEEGQTSIQHAKTTDTDAMPSENLEPKCRVCGSTNLRPDHGGNYCDAVDANGLPLLCVGHGELMREQIEPGEGYRLINKQKDTPMEGDEHYDFDGWRKRSYPSHPFVNTDTYRRRIPAKPEAMEIDGHTISFDSRTVRIGCLLSPFFCSRTKAIRQLGEWLISVADWREAQAEPNHK